MWYNGGMKKEDSLWSKLISSRVLQGILLLFIAIYFIAWLFMILVLWQIPFVMKVPWITGAFPNNVLIIVSAFTPLASLILGYVAVRTILENRRLFNKERDIQRIIQRTEEVQEWILEICNVASSASPPGDEQERRNRKWRAEKIVFLKDSIKAEAKKLDSEFTSGEKLLEGIVNELSAIIEEHKSDPSALAGVRSGESISNQIILNANKALGIISNIKDKLEL